MDKLNIKKEETVFDNYFEIVQADIEVGKGDGARIIKRLKLDRPDAVSVLIFNSDTNEFVLVKQNRYPIVAKNGNDPIYETPAGIVDPGEEPIEAAIRETREEVGYEVKADNMDLFREYYSGVGYSSERIFLYFTTVTNKDRVEEGGGLEDEGEFLEVIHVSKDEVFRMLDTNEIVDGKTIISLFFIRTALMDAEIENLNG